MGGRWPVRTLLVFRPASARLRSSSTPAGAGPSTLLLSGACPTAIDQRAPCRSSRLPAAVPPGALLDAWLQDLASAAPVVLLIDDINGPTRARDVLMYLVGTERPRLRLLAAVRVSCCLTVSVPPMAGRRAAARASEAACTCLTELVPKRTRVLLGTAPSVFG
jgi:hypothetical protein